STSLRAGGIAVIGIFAVCIVIFMAKGLFSNSDNGLPAGIDTGTINTNQTSPATEANADLSDKKSKNTSKTEKESESSKTEDSSIAESIETAFVNQYAYLHTEPDKDAENIVCMSPNIEVTVLEKLESGYWKVTFMNIDGQKTGYVWNEYLQSSPVS
ncbi:MAG: SH3 domain-containing protein, partial [Ruminococcus sp.]|nr:SH3 domain-containing protein [Ruminococcus sp.]